MLSFIIKGTFESGEEDKEELAYGLVHNIRRFNPLYVQVSFNSKFEINIFLYFLK